MIHQIALGKAIRTTSELRRIKISARRPGVDSQGKLYLRKAKHNFME
jgi:hypothetical protein